MPSNARIMIVDDEARFRITLGNLLRSKGLDVITFGSAVEALQEMERGAFDVVLLDVKMPEMNGVEALAEIKKIDAGIEVIILTGYASVDVAVEIMKLGAYDYMLKPCSVDELTAKIEAAHEKKIEREKRGLKARAPKLELGDSKGITRE